MTKLVKDKELKDIGRGKGGIDYSIQRVAECLSLRQNWVPPPPTPLDPKRGEQHSLAGEGVGGPNSDD